ncbi:MAG TPA: prepilin peptidase [Actinomycetota bacterium]|nr:prepilin peptidase [Actinomycetota bacterium]
MYAVALASGLGLIFGSFASVVAHRVPRHQPIVKGRSQCPHCDHTISAVENIPVISYLALRGRCRHCREPISPKYPLIELASGILFGASAHKFGLSISAVVFAAFFWTLVVLTVIDLEHKLLPNRIVYPAFVLGFIGLAVSGLVDSDWSRLTDAVIGSLIFGGFLFTVAFIYPAGMGAGDFKLAFVLGLFLGYAGGVGVVLAGMFLSFLAGGIVGLIVLAVRRGGRKTEVPFGPYLALGTTIAIFAGRRVVDWYLSGL